MAGDGGRQQRQLPQLGGAGAAHIEMRADRGLLVPLEAAVQVEIEQLPGGVAAPGGRVTV